jgi:hypothetical protein
MRKIFLILTGLLLFNCTSTDPIQTTVVSCNTTNTAFQQLYNPLNTTAFPENLSGYPNAVTHEYTFNVTTAATICSVGYQSQTVLASQNYTIEIYDTVTSTVVASVASTFSSTTTSYVSLSTPLSLIAGRSYKIKRHSPATSANPNGAGRCVSNNVTGAGNVSFPKTSGNLTITDSDFYSQNVSAGDNKNSLPYIDIVFQ